MSETQPDPITRPADAYERARRMAVAVAGSSAYKDNGFLDINKLLSLHGGEAVRRDSDVSLLVWDKNRFRIYIESMQSNNRKRMQTARMLYRAINDYSVPGRTGRYFIEHGDNGTRETMTSSIVFATTLMMPETQFLKAWDEFDGREWQLSAQFGTSPLAVRNRHGYLTGGEYDPSAY